MKSLIDVARYENKLRKIVELNLAGASVFTDKTSQVLNSAVSKSEFIEAFKDDIDKTARYLVDSLGIINSISNGLVMALESLDNTVESFFGETFKNGIITLSGVNFDVKKRVVFEKAEYIDFIYSNLFDITRKDLNILVKALTKYETAKSDIEKAVLYPSIVLADKLIEKMGYFDLKFNDFRRKLSYEDQLEFSAMFNRSGVCDVIQNSTYIDIRGVRQVCSKHKNQMSSIARLAEGIKTNEYKYIESFEFDGEASVKGAMVAAEQISRLKINCEHKFTLKFRKLGNYKARGVYFNSSFIVAEEVKDTSALLHEIAHFIHMSNPNIAESNFVNYMIGKLSKRINFDNIDERIKNNFIQKSSYYNDPKEIVARALEIAALIANESSRVIFSSGDYEMIKSREYYELREGVYFDFNSFDEETISEMLNLWELFYETSHDDIKNTNIDNFYKIDTNYRRVKLEKVDKTITEILNDERKKAEKEKRFLYAMVTPENINMIIQNRPRTLSLDSICTMIFGNLHFCSGHAKSLTAEGWAEVKESKSMMVLMMLDMIKATKTEVQYLEYLYELDKNKVLDIMDGACLVSGFNIKWRMEIKKKLNEKYPEGAFKSFNTFYSSIARNVFNIASDEIINNYEYMKQYISENKYFLDQVKYSMSEENIIRHSFDILNEHEMSALSFPKVVFSNSKFVITYFAKNPTNVDDIRYCSEEILSNTTVMYNVLTSIAGAVNSENFYIAFNSISIELHEDVDFVKHFMQFHNCIVDGVSEDVRNIILGKQEEVIVEVKKTKSTKIKKAKVENIEIDEVKNERFEKILQSVQIIEKPHSQTGEILKTFKVEEDLGKDFQSFAKYLKSNDIGYYSRFLRAFVVNNIERISAASVVVTSYNQDLLELFAQGRLF